MGLAMELSSLQATVLLLPLLLVGFFYLVKIKSSCGSAQRLPPGPRGLPVVGNLHQVCAPPHRALRELAAAHGAPDLMRLRLGQVPTVVASSPRAAAELMRAHDHAFATRPYFRTAEILTYGFRDLAFAPHGEHWRHARRLCTAHVLSSNRSRTYNAMREQEVSVLIKSIKNHLPIVDMSKTLYGFANDVICRAVSGKWFREEGRGEVFRDLIEENTALLGGFCVGDYFPMMAWADALPFGTAARATANFARWDELLETVVQEHEKMRHSVEVSEGGDFVDVLLLLRGEKQDDGFELTMDIIKSLLADMFAAGTETSYIALEWAMSELVKNPTAMHKLQREVRATPLAGGMVRADALGAMQYLKAVVKETLRLHPPVPLLLPRECMEDCTVQGYHVAKGTRVFVNAWAINRDPSSWDAPEDFVPERFMESEVDFRGSHFQFIPFGAGRRICPGMQFGLATVELALANLVHLFDWELPHGVAVEELDMSDGPGLTTPRRTSLRLLAKPFGLGKEN